MICHSLTAPHTSMPNRPSSTAADEKDAEDPAIAAATGTGTTAACADSAGAAALNAQQQRIAHHKFEGVMQRKRARAALLGAMHATETECKAGSRAWDRTMVMQLKHFYRRHAAHLRNPVLTGQGHAAQHVPILQVRSMSPDAVLCCAALARLPGPAVIGFTPHKSAPSSTAGVLQHTHGQLNSQAMATSTARQPGKKENKSTVHAAGGVMRPHSIQRFQANFQAARPACALLSSADESGTIQCEKATFSFTDTCSAEQSLHSTSCCATAQPRPFEVVATGHTPSC